MSNTAQAKAVSLPSMIDLGRLDAPDVMVRHKPFSFMAVNGMLPMTARDQLIRDFPRYQEAGFFEYDPARCGPTINALVAEIRSDEFALKLGVMLDVPELPTKPLLVHVSSRQNRRHGTIHTDSRSKLVTALFYFNADWPHGSAGCLRFLANGDSISATIAPEVRPLFGTMAAFRRSNRSFHGYLPFEGERLVIQAAWLTNEKALKRKNSRSRVSHFFKKAIGPIDRWFGAGRDASKAHRD